MLKVENVQVFGLEAAIRGMRNPLNSWSKSDSEYVIQNLEDVEFGYEPNYEYEIGEADLILMKRLAKAGTEHRKFMRMITVYVDITAPLYWWKEADTYKVGTVANSTSTMHTIHKKEFTLEDFSCEHLTTQSIEHLKNTISLLNYHRSLYILKTDKQLDRYTIMTDECYAKYKKDIWWQMIQLLPSSYNQKRTVMLNYEVAANILRQRKGHKLDEWNILCEQIEKLPYFKEIMEDAE